MRVSLPDRLKQFIPGIDPPSIPLAVLVAALLAAWVDFSRMHTFESGDSLVPILISLQKWTPFYWDADRVGMLVPLLALPLRSPFLNLLFQTWLDIFAGFLVSFLLLRYVLGRGSIWFLAGALVNVTGMVLLSPSIQFDWFIIQQLYSMSVALALGACIVLEKPGALRHSLGIALMLLAHWVNFSAFLILAPVILLHFAVGRQRSDLTRLLPALALGALGGLWMKSMAFTVHAEDTTLGLLGPAQWMNAWKHLLHNAREALLPHPLQLLWLILPALAGAVLLLSGRSRHPKLVLGLGAALGAAGLSNLLLLGTMQWVTINLLRPRYTYLALLCVLAGLMVLAAVFLEWLAGARWAAALVLVLLLASVSFRYGRPSCAAVRNDLDQRFGAITKDILATHATVIAGNYWKIWPAVFYTNLVLYEQGSRQMIYGVSYRSSPTDPLWTNFPRERLCAAALAGDNKAVLQLTEAGLHFTAVEHLPTIDLYKFADHSNCALR